MDRLDSRSASSLSTATARAKSRATRCAGEANALRAVGVLGRWNRAARLSAMFSGSCSCCVGEMQMRHIDRQAVDYFYTRHSADPALEALLRRCGGPLPRERSIEDEAADAPMPVASMMRWIATETDAAAADAHARLLCDFEALLDQIEGSA